MILVGPGTGVAPMMGFLQERRFQKASGITIGNVVLFFGCRSEEAYIYESELRSYVADGTLAQLHVAFSRTGNKEYVQTLMKKHSQVLCGLLQARRTVASTRVGSLAFCPLSRARVGTFVSL